MLQRALLLSQQVEVQWKFPTEVFFMTLRGLHSGFVAHVVLILLIALLFNTSRT